MKKLFASVMVVCMLASGMTAFAADEAVLDDDMLIVEEIQGDVMPISETDEAVPAADAAEVTTEEATEEAAKETAEEATEETAEEAEEVVLDYEVIKKDAVVIGGNTVAIAGGLGRIEQKDGVIFVPIRAILEAAGYQVTWSDAEQMVMGANQETGAMVIMQLGNNLLFFLDADGEEGKTEMEAAPFKNEEEWRTYAPIKAMAEALGYKIGFDAETANVTFNK
ncbi:MAG: copper amine oxidase N-terminal domain-containing protein [Clostridia bacterium]|nr:copper amine oxidase N-terminal domain-containing protein [Clostridia bacterium]